MAFKLTKETLRPTTSVMQLVHPVYGLSEAAITLRGTMSAEFLAGQEKVLKALGPDTDANSLTRAEQLELFGQVYVDCIVGWSDDLTEVLGEFSPEVALQLFTDPELAWIGGQIALHIGNTANFFCKPTAGVGAVGGASDK